MTKVARATKFPVILVEGEGKGAKATIGEKERAAIAKHATCTALSLTGVALADLSIVSVLPKLDDLRLYRTAITDWSALVTVKTLRELFVNGLRDPAPLAIVSKLSQLTKLSILHVPTLTKLPDLSKLTKLRSLTIWSCKRLADVSALAKIPAACDVSAVDLPVSDEDIEKLRAPKKSKKSAR